MFKTTIKDKELEYTVDYRNVKYIRYELKGNVLKLILPKRFNGNVEDCVHNKDKWIYGKLVEYERSQKELEQKTLNKNVVHRSLQDLKIISGYYINKYENLLNVRAKKVQFRHTTTKWGSCSSLGNITLSKDLKYLPEDVIAYVIYHELSHLIVLNHSDKFYDLIKKEFPNYEDYDDTLREYFYLIRKEK